jgi:hypothetical protein
MSKILTLMLIVVMSFTTMAQAPEGINYQAVIRNNVGDIIPSQPVGLKISILQGSSTGTAIYEESFTPTTNQFGLINIVVGQGTVLSGSFPTVDWGNGPYFVEVAADASGGTNYTVMGTQQLMSVPYALYSKYSENPGPQGPPGNDGADGLSAYEVWLAQGNTGTEADFLNSLQGADGATGPQGPAGNDGATGPQGIAGNDGVDGLSAYEVWLAQGNTGTEVDFLNSLQGVDGATGPQGPAGNDGATGPQGIAGNDGVDGLSAYEVWLAQGNTGTEVDFLNSLQGVDGATGPQGPAGNDGATGPQGATGAQGPAGNDGADGLSAYEVWLSQGNTGTESDFLNSLQGADGATGPQGATGPSGPAGGRGRPTVGNTCTSGCWTLPGWTLSGGTGAYHTLAAGCGYLPIYVDKNKSFVQIGIYNNVAVSGLCRLGIYSWNDGFPDTLLMDLGLIDITGGGNQSIPINLNIDEGFYFVAIATNNGIVANGIQIAAHNPPVTAGWGALSAVGDRVVLTQTIPFVNFTGGFPNQITGPFDNAYDYFYNIRFQEAP